MTPLLAPAGWTLLLLAPLAGPPAHATPSGPAAAQRTASGGADASAHPAVIRTGKERLGDKATDEQRVDDCKVPLARRTHARPTGCPWDIH